VTPTAVRILRPNKPLSWKPSFRAFIAILPPVINRGPLRIPALNPVQSGWTSRPPAEIRLREIYETLEGRLNLIHCLDDPDRCSRNRFCVARDVWSEIQAQIARSLESITLSAIVTRHRNKEQSLELAYDI